MIKRYSWAHAHGDTWMSEEPDGDYVRYDDYEARVTAMRSVLQRCRDVLASAALVGFHPNVMIGLPIMVRDIEAALAGLEQEVTP